MSATVVVAEQPVRGAVIRVEPLGRAIETLPGEPLMRAARRAGLRWPTICNGAALCGTCHCRVTSHSEPLAPPSAKERAALLSVPPHLQGPSTRLACQLVPSGEITVERAGVTPVDPTPKQANSHQGSAND